MRENSKQTPESLEKSTQLSPDQIRRGIEWLRLKELAIVNETKSSVISLGKNGIESFQKGLPERRLLNLLKNGHFPLIIHLLLENIIYHNIYPIYYNSQCLLI